METPNTSLMAVGDTEEKNLELSAKIASVNLLFAQQALGQRIIDPTITTKGLLDIAEHSYKVSGMQKKQEPKDQGGKFVFNFNLGGGKQLHIEKEVAGQLVEQDTPDMLAVSANTLVESLSFGDAPEF